VAARIEMMWLLEGSNHEPVEILNDVVARIEMLWLLEGQIHKPVKILHGSNYKSRSWMTWRLESRCHYYSRGEIKNRSRSWNQVVGSSTGPPPNNELANANSETAKPPFLRSGLLLFCACFSPISLALMSNFVWGRNSPGFDCIPHLGSAVLLLLSELLSSSDLLGHCFWLCQSVPLLAQCNLICVCVCVWVCWRVERGWRRNGLVGWLVVRRSLK
jgi:hypothetical protein